MRVHETHTQANAFTLLQRMCTSARSNASKTQEEGRGGGGMKAEW